MYIYIYRAGPCRLEAQARPGGGQPAGGETPCYALMLSTCCLLALFVFLFLLLLFVRGARLSRASSPRASDMATATSISEPEGEEGNKSVEEEQPTHGDPGSDGWKTVSKFSHPIYRKLSCLNGELNALSLSELKEKLTTLNLSSV